MIISSTNDSIAAGTDLAVYLPEPEINVEPNKVISVSSIIGGGSSISIWQANIAGLTVEPEFTVRSGILATLRAIKDSGIDEWLIRTQGKIFVGIFDLISVTRQKSQSDKYQVKIKIVILSEETDK
jgi:hypothetical protein